MDAAKSISRKTRRQSRLSTPDSEKDTRHFEIDLTNWGLSFEPGDSVAVYPTNDPPLVEDEIIRALGAKGDEPVAAAKRRNRSAKRCCAITRSRNRRQSF